MPFQIQYSEEHGGFVVAGLIAPAEAADFITAFNIAVQEQRGVDIYYQLYDDNHAYFNAVSDRAKQFFAKKFYWNEKTHCHGSYPNMSDWTHKPPTDFVFAELKPGMTLPEDAWGKRPT